MTLTKVQGPRVWLHALVLLVLFAARVEAQEGQITFRTSFSDFRFDEVAKSYVTSGGNLVEVVRDRFAGTGGIGGDYTYVSESGRWMTNFGAEYRTAGLFGSGGFRVRYSPDANNPQFGEPQQVKDATQYFRSIMGFGFDMIPSDGLFLVVNPNLDIQWGQRVFMEDAYKAFVDRGYSEPGDFKVENGLLVGFTVRINGGFWLSENYGLIFSPGLVWSKRLQETFQGIDYGGVQTMESSYGYEFSFGLAYRISR